MICYNNYLADILRVCGIKDLIWVMRFQSPLVYFQKHRKALLWSKWLNRGSYMSTPVLFNSLNKLGKRDKMGINSIKYEHKS